MTELKSESESSYLKQNLFEENRKQIDIKFYNLKESVESSKKAIDKNLSILKDLEQDVDLKSDRIEVDKIKIMLEDFCKYTDLKALYDKVVPNLQKLEEDLDDLNRDMLTNKEIIRRFDEVMTTKASKITVQRLELLMNDYLTVTQFNSFEKTQDQKHHEVKLNLVDFENKLHDISQMAECEIRDNIKEKFVEAMHNIKQEIKHQVTQANTHEIK